MQLTTAAVSSCRTFVGCCELTLSFMTVEFRAGARSMTFNIVSGTRKRRMALTVCLEPVNHTYEQVLNI